MSKKQYFFEEPLVCEMCGSPTGSHKVLGQRLNQSQGLSPHKKTGISVSVKKCTQCKLIYASPQPIPHNILDHYGVPPDDYWPANYFELSPEHSASELSHLFKFLTMSPGMRALDVGAGIGKSMIAFEKAGFETYGLEASEPFYQLAVNKMGIDPSRLKLTTIEEADYPDSYFDFIEFGAVLEHFYHPADCIKRSLKWLKPGGIIHLEVPSSSWLIAKMLNFYYRLRGTNYVTNISPMHTPFHLYEFSLNSFAELGKHLGFSVVGHRHEVCKIYYLPKFLHPLFNKIMKSTDTGMQLIVYLKKNEN